MSESIKNSNTTFNRSTIIRSVITLAVLVALYVLIRRLSGVLLPFLISFQICTKSPANYFQAYST